MQIFGDEAPYDTEVPLWVNLYCSIHFLLTVYGSNEIARLSRKDLPYLTVLAVVAYLIFALTNFGLIFDQRYNMLPYLYTMHTYYTQLLHTAQHNKLLIVPKFIIYSLSLSPLIL